MTQRSAALPSSEPPAEWTLLDLGAVLARRRSWLFSALALCGGLAILYGLCATPRYRASADIEIQKEFHGAFGLQNTTSDKDSTEVSDSFDLNLTLQTESSILQSDSLALDVIRRSGLEATPDYFAPRRDHFAWVHRIFFWRKALEPLAIPLADAPNRRYAALKIFAGHLKIAQLPGTRIIRIAYADRDPARAALVVNNLVQALSDYTYQSQSSAAAQSASWLSGQLAGLRQQAESLDARAAALESATGSYGDDASHNVVLSRLDELNAELSAAESSRIVREAIWRAVQTGDPEVISGLGGSAAASNNTQNSYALLQTLRGQETTAKAQLAESANRYGDNWPGVAEQRARLAAIQKSIQDEVHRLGDRARSDYQIALQSEGSARDAFNQQKELASRITGSAVAWRLARQEADESRALYTTLLGRLQQTGVLEGLHSGNFTVVSPARVPPPNHPTSPNPPLLAALAVAAGLTTGAAAAIGRELTDNTIHSAAELESLLDAPVFAALPTAPCRERRLLRSLQDSWLARLLPGGFSAARTSPAALALEASGGSDFALPVPQSSYVEALHCLRASLQLSHSGGPPQIITFAAAEPPPGGPAPGAAPVYQEEDQPSLALSLAAVLAQHGAPVLFLDADLRSAPLPGGLGAEPGLSDLLAGDHSEPIKDTGTVFDHPGPALLSVLATGPRPPCPSELIASARMAMLFKRWRQEFAFIVIDGPAAVYADALVLAQLSDAVLLTARAGKTPKSALVPAFHALSRQVPDHAVLGLILEEVPAGGRNARA